MTIPIAPQQLVTTALIDFLKAGLAPIKVGDHVIPREPGDIYTIVYRIDRGEASSGPPLTAPDADWALAFQITSTGRRRDQAEWLADKVRTLILGRTETGAFGTALPAIAGWTVCGRVSSSAASGVHVEGTEPNRMFSVPDRYTLHVTPA